MTAPANEIQEVLTTIGQDFENGVEWVVGETKTAVLTLWDAAKPLFTQFEPTLVSDGYAAVMAFLPKAEAGGSLDDLEQAFLQSLEAEGHPLFGQLQALASSSGSMLLQVLLALAKTALKIA